MKDENLVTDSDIQYEFKESKRIGLDCIHCDVNRIGVPLCRTNKDFKCMRDVRQDGKDGYFKKIPPCTK